MWIQNCAADDIPKKFHIEPGENSMLIQIMDPCAWWPEPKHKFKEIHQFEFLDIEDDDENAEELGISDAQAAQLVELLKHAYKNKMNVIVHCFAGICRSGAVCEVGVMMGFADTERARIPNLRVKQKMMKVLGWTYDSTEKPDWTSYRHLNYDTWIEPKESDDV